MKLRRNIELKARCADLAHARRAARRLGATREGILRQIDTYIVVGTGRLKLREIRGKGSELIWYQRGNSAAARDSRYTLAPVADPMLLKSALSAALGVRAVVKKRRELWLFHNVRIHLDRVDSLGEFIEFEAVIRDAAEVKPSRERLKLLAAAMGIQSRDRIATSYGDMINGI